MDVQQPAAVRLDTLIPRPGQAILGDIANVAHGGASLTDHRLRLIVVQVEVLANIGLFLVELIQNIEGGQQGAQDP